MNPPNRKFKYHNLLEEYNIVDTCPCGELSGDNRNSYRWSLNPIDHELNFLPNVLYNKLNLAARPRRANDKVDLKRVCGECGISFFTSLNEAKNYFFTLGQPARISLGYTHIAEGAITEEDGLRTEINKHGHFNFYEYDGVDFKTSFQIVETLSNS